MTKPNIKYPPTFAHPKPPGHARIHSVSAHKAIGFKTPVVKYDPTGQSTIYNNAVPLDFTPKTGCIDSKDHKKNCCQESDISYASYFGSNHCRPDIN